MAEKVNELTGNKAGIIRARPRIWETKKRLLASLERARELLGYKPKVNFDAGLKATVEWFRTHWNEIRRHAEFPPVMSAAAARCSRPEGTRYRYYRYRNRCSSDD